jgi:hypothetical protein
VALDGGVRDAELEGNLLVAFSVDDEIEHFALACAEIGVGDARVAGAADGLGQPWGVGESGGTYYATPEQVAKTNRERADVSLEGRMEGIAIEAYRTLLEERKDDAAYRSVFNLVWYGLRLLPLGLPDTFPLDLAPATRHFLKLSIRRCKCLDGKPRAPHSQARLDEGQGYRRTVVLGAIRSFSGDRAASPSIVSARLGCARSNPGGDDLFRVPTDCS